MRNAGKLICSTEKGQGLALGGKHAQLFRRPYVWVDLEGSAGGSGGLLRVAHGCVGFRN
jgi:hypothetical protein